MPLLNELPKDLPMPQDDGKCNHLLAMEIPSISLQSTNGGCVNLSAKKGYVVLYCYPMTGRPNVPLPDGWDAIPGARGCTPQSCSFRDHYQELEHFGASVYGLSTQSSEYQKEAAERLHLPFGLLSDEQMAFAKALSLPTFSVDGRQLIKRITLIIKAGLIKKVFYPVFPPDQNAMEVIHWLEANAG